MLDWLLYTIFSIAYTAHSMWFIKYSALSHDHIERSMGILLFSIVCCLHLYFVRHEVYQVKAATGHKVYQAKATNGSMYWAMIVTHLIDPWNIQDLFRLTVVTAALVYYCVLLVDSSSDGHVDPYGLRLVSTISAITIPLFALGFLFYLQAIKGFGALVRMVFKIIESASYFLAVLVILTFGYSASFNLMTLTDSSTTVVDDASWNNYTNSLLSSALLIMGVDVPIDAITESHYALVAVMLLVSFLLLMAVIMLNLLIAIMSDEHREIKDQEYAAANYNRASIVVEYEKLMSAADKQRPEYSPKYLQVLRPEKVLVRDDKNEDIQALEQVVHDRTDELRKHTDEQNSCLKNMLETQAEDTNALWNDLKEENNTLRTELKQVNAEFAQKLDAQAKDMREENHALRTELRKLSEAQIQSTSELKDMLIKMMANQDN